MRRTDVRQKHALTLLLPIVALAVACAGVPPPQFLPEGGETYRVGAADELAYRVLPDPAIEGTATVRPDGRISVDLIGDVDAAGRTTLEIAEEIQRRIAQYRQGPVVTVAVQKATSASVAVMGEVMRPGRFAIAEQTRIADAVALAGGATKLAAAARVRLVRWEGNRSVLYVADLDDISEGAGVTNVVLLDGDVVYVPPALPVAVGYAIRRALYPIEALISVVSGGLVGALAAGG